MCKMTNKFVENTLKGIRHIEDSKLEEMSIEDLAKLYTEMYVIQEEMKSYMDIIKPVLAMKQNKDQFFPEMEKKIIITKGNDKTEYDTVVLYNTISAKYGPKERTEFLQCLNFNKSKAESYPVIMQEATNIAVVHHNDEKTIKVLKMTKQELKEHTIK